MVQEVDGLFPTIEDYMWFQLALIRSAPIDDDVNGSGGGVAASGIQVATLEGLQQYLCHFPPGHYSHQGKPHEPHASICKEDGVVIAVKQLSDSLVITRWVSDCLVIANWVSDSLVIAVRQLSDAIQLPAALPVSAASSLYRKQVGSWVPSICHVGHV